MADHKIKISGDFSGITQGFKNLSDSITEISSKKYKLKLDDEEFKDFVKNVSKSMDEHQKSLEERTQRLASIASRSFKELQKAYEAGTDPRRIDILQQRFGRLSRALSESSKQLKTVSTSQEGLLGAKADKPSKQEKGALSGALDFNRKALEDRRQRLGAAVSQTFKELQRAYEGSTDPKRVDSLRQRFERLNKSLADTNKALKQLAITEKSSTSAARGQGGGMFGKMGDAMEGAPGMVRGLGGTGMLGRLGMMGRFLGPVGAVAGAAVAGVGLAYNLGSTRRQITPDNLALQAYQERTGGQLKGIRNQGISNRTGFTPIESVRQAVDLEKATGAPTNFPMQELGGKTTLDQMQKMSREYGVQPEELTGMAGQLRQTGMGGGESLKKLQDIFTQGTAAGVERARLPDFAKSQVGLLEQQAQSGTASVKGLESLNALLSRNKFFSDNPQRTLSVARGLDSAFKQQQGPGSIAAFDVLSKMTGGSMSPFQAVRMKRLGLFKSMEELQSKGAIKDVSEGITKFVEELGSLKLGKKIDVHKLKKGTDEFAAMALSLQDVMGVEDITLVEQMLEALSQDKKVSEDWMNSKIKAAKRSSNILERVMKSTDADIQRLEAAIQGFKMDTGDIANAVTTGLHKFVDDMLNSFKTSITEGFSRLNPFNVENMFQKAKDSLQDAQVEALPEAQKALNHAGGDRAKAVEAAKAKLSFQRQKYREIGSSVGDFVPGMTGQKEAAEKEMMNAKMVLENLLGHRFNMGQEQNLHFDPKIAAPMGQTPLTKEEVEKLQTNADDSAAVSETDRSLPEKAVKEESKIRSEDVDKLKGKEPATVENKGKSPADTGGVDTVPGTNVLVTPMNRLKDSIDGLTEIMNIVARQQDSAVGSRSGSAGTKKRIGN